MIQAFTIGSVYNHAHNDSAAWHTFPQAFSTTPISVVANTCGDNDQDVWTYGWTNTGCYVNIPSGSGSSGLPVSIIAIGSK